MEKIKNIQKVCNEKLCIGCGICAANCPLECIEMNKIGYETVPVMDNEKCISCTICAKVCPVNQIAKYNGEERFSQFFLGKYKRLLCAQTKNESLLAAAQSGGIVTTLIQALLHSGEYDCAFLVDNRNKEGVIQTKRYTSEDNLLTTTGSQYITIVHQDAMNYIMEHPRERVIFVAQGCVMDGIINTIKQQSLDRENYLLIGLFCDKTMNNGVLHYFSQHPACENGKVLKNIVFRCKAAGGWPGKVRLCFEDGNVVDLPISERGKIKNYFMPERCLYCMDKLNFACDIAVGDNYIGKNADTRGKSSVIIRTLLGEKVWKEKEDLFYTNEEDLKAFAASQVLESKRENYRFAVIKGLYGNQQPYTKKEKKMYAKKLATIHLRETVPQEQLYEKINKKISKEESIKRVKKYIRKIVPCFR